MKKLLVIGLAVSLVLAFAAGALADTWMDVSVDTQAYTTLTEVVRTDFVLDFENSEFTPTGASSSFQLEKHMHSVPTAGWPISGGLTGVKTIDTYDGITTFVEGAVSGGYTGANGFISEYIYNEGEIHILKNLNNKGEWNLLERKEIWGSGLTRIEKDIGTWGLNGGEMHPTDAAAYIEFSSSPSVISYTDNYFNSGVGGYFVSPLPSYAEALGWCLDRPPAVIDQIEYFESTIVTNEPFWYYEEVEVDPYWPNIVP